MSHDFARPLNTNELAHSFLTKALKFESDEASEYADEICRVEYLLEREEASSTLYNPKSRLHKYKDNHERAKLRERIFEELVKIERLEDDEEIKLGRGGAKPISEVQNTLQAFILVGLPAAGKSSVAAKIAEKYGAYIVDSDYAKRKFPEFKHEESASRVHDESAFVTFGTHQSGEAERNLFEYCSYVKANMVIPKIGSSVRSLRDIYRTLTENEYNTHLILVNVDRVESCKRAILRFIKTKRYVPIGMIFDGFANDCELTFYKVINNTEFNWKSHGVLYYPEGSAVTPDLSLSTRESPVHIFSKDQPSGDSI
ncbi:zeta toxin family protein [Chromobacterium violaceum]